MNFLFRFPLFASLAFRVLSLCAVVKVRFAVPEDDIVKVSEGSQFFVYAGLAPAGESVARFFFSCSLTLLSLCLGVDLGL